MASTEKKKFTDEEINKIKTVKDELQIIATSLGQIRIQQLNLKRTEDEAINKFNELLSEVNNSNELTLFENSVNVIINDELHNLYSELNTFMLEEGFFDSFKKIGKKLVNKIKDGIRRFYDNIIKKIINRYP